MSQHVALKAKCKILGLVSTQVTYLIEVAPYKNVASNNSFMTTKSIMNVYPGRLLYYHRKFLHG